MSNFKNNHIWWISIAVVGQLLAVPVGIVVKIGTDSIDPGAFTWLRFLIVALILMPFVVTGLNKINKKNIKYIIYASIATPFAGTAYSYSVQQGEVSIIAVAGLVTPIVFVIYSIWLVHEKVNKGSVVGIALALLGAAALVITPMLIGGGMTDSTPVSAILLALVDAVLYPFIIIYARKAHESGVPVLTTLGIISLFSAIVIFPLVSMQNESLNYLNWSGESLMAVLYSGIAVAFLSRFLIIQSYQRLGSFVTSSLTYAQSFLAVLLPIVILGESLPLDVMLWGAVIFVGVIITDKYHNIRRMRVSK